MNKVRSVLKKIPPETIKIIMPRVLGLPKRGGILPLLPILGALGGIGSLVGGISGLIKTIKDLRSGSALHRGGRLSRNVYVKPYGKGYGLYLEPYKGPYPYSGI